MSSLFSLKMCRSCITAVLEKFLLKNMTEVVKKYDKTVTPLLSPLPQWRGAYERWGLFEGELI